MEVPAIGRNLLEATSLFTVGYSDTGGNAHGSKWSCGTQTAESKYGLVMVVPDLLADLRL